MYLQKCVDKQEIISYYDSELIKQSNLTAKQNPNLEVLTMSLSESQLCKVQSAIDHHERFKNAYFWSPPANAAGRRSYESKNSFSVKFKHNGDVYEYDSSVSCSCKNVYYRGTFTVNGKRKTVRAFKNLVS